MRNLKQNRAAVFITAASALFVAAFLYLYYVQPEEIGPQQPIPFSHNVHNGIKEIQCQFCHPYVAYSNFPGIPPVEKCLYCHNFIIPKFHLDPERARLFQYPHTDSLGQGELYSRARLFQPSAPHQQQDCLRGVPWRRQDSSAAARESLAHGRMREVPPRQEGQLGLLARMPQLRMVSPKAQSGVALHFVFAAVHRKYASQSGICAP